MRPGYTFYRCIRDVLKKSLEERDECCYDAVKEALEDICLNMDWSVEDFDRLAKEVEIEL